MTRPADHPARLTLNDEIHARPSEPLYGPTRLSYLAILSPPSAREEERACVAALCARFGSSAPPPTGNHFSVDLGPLRYARVLEEMLVIWANARSHNGAYNYYLRPEPKAN